MKKKILSLCLVVAMAATAVVGASMAYLTDEDEAVNVMTLGNVQIEQIEQERDANGNLVDFTQAKPLYPAVGEIAWNDAKININGHDYNMFGDKLKNAVDKIVTVKNTGKSDAYVRTWIAVEDPFTTALIGVNVGGTGYTRDPNWTVAEIGGVQYSVACFTYNAALEPGEVSLPSFLQVYMSSAATNEDVALLGNTHDILVFSQAVQTEGFADAKTALTAAFGTDHPWTDKAPAVPVVVESVQELKDAMLIRGANIVLADDIVVDKDTPLQWGQYMFVANGREVTIDLNGKNIVVEEDASLKTNGLFTTANGGTLNIVGEGTVEVKNGKSGIFHAMNKNDQINVYGGTYISNSDNGSDALAIIYTNSGNVDVYGGKFIPYDGVTCANAEDIQGNRLSIVFHEGTLLKHEKYQIGDSTRIQLAEGCTLEEVVIDGVTWYQVVKQ